MNLLPNRALFFFVHDKILCTLTKFLVHIFGTWLISVRIAVHISVQLRVLNKTGTCTRITCGVPKIYRNVPIFSVHHQNMYKQVGRVQFCVLLFLVHIISCTERKWILGTEMHVFWYTLWYTTANSGTRTCSTKKLDFTARLALVKNPTLCQTGRENFNGSALW